ncbi:hypothetical protein IMG5_109990 [Ichthyophthirius multifiliis]|uniref:Transmembrane protein n=1 Tax=Ichthyophthirius multifiliis TaxID=5932 RepID=G0QTM8_ICHMU|nr:hypothetical protein IMG5_109990 [Ichthyophthirius multifiliis]EGR31428.1 hypothetical protein IMG5_109990 [Ichthyophthirius multifiliis]|eukprot:XP_004034914.1 hypothetical protein IMG5_109990 [Ichthyophthirius multifiliis]
MITRLANKIIFKSQQTYKFSSSTTLTDHHENNINNEQYLNQVRQRYTTPEAQNWAYLDYKPHPSTQLSHYDSKSKDYISSERDDYNAQTTTQSKNAIIDQFKRNLELQRKVHNILAKMDRPYLRGVPGIHTTISKGLQDYSGKPLTECTGNRSDFYEDAYKNENRWLDQSVYYPKFFKMTHFDVEWPKELANRPVTKDFHHDKGYKYDVEVPYDQRYDYFADRLGHPEILGTPAERLLRLEGDIYHPNFLDQPFVKLPSVNPHESLNFEEGEILYENTRLLEWAKFWTYSTLVGYFWCAFFVPYQLMFKTHMPLEHAFDNIFWPYYQHTQYMWDNNGLHIPAVAGIACYATHVLLHYMNNLSKDYVVRAQYSKDKELLFVTRISPFGSTKEEVYEVAHLEHLPPSVKSGVKDMSCQDSNGLVDIICMNTQRSLVFYLEEQYWNPKIRNDFFNQTNGMWSKDYTGLNRLEQQEWDLQQQVVVGENLEKKPLLEQQ